MLPDRGRHEISKKEAKLDSLGWKVLRFTNAQVIQQTETVISTILGWKDIRVLQ